MQLREQLAVITNPDRLRIYKDKEMIYADFVGALSLEEIGLDGTEVVKKLRATPEIRHKQWKELGLMQPMTPEETPDYSFHDLQTKLYYDIYI